MHHLNQHRNAPFEFNKEVLCSEKTCVGQKTSKSEERKNPITNMENNN